MGRVQIVLAAWLALLLGPAWADGMSYAVVVSKETRAEWSDIVAVLVDKHHATVVEWEGSVDAAHASLSGLHPRYACFVARPEEAGRDFVIAIHRMTRALDDDPYGDCLWGIVTGYEQADALRIARRAEPLRIRRVVAGWHIPLDGFVEGAWYSHREKNVWWEKKAGGVPEMKSGPDDTTKYFVDELNRGCDLFATSGHATFREWHIGYSYANGRIACEQGRLFGLDMAGNRHPIDSASPKVYTALGNCLMGLIPDREAMALAWMHSGGALQMVGYTVETWYGHGWGVDEYFLPGRHSLSESFYLDAQALAHQLETAYPQAAKKRIERFNLSQDPTLHQTLASQLGLATQDELGLLWDRDTIAFYGDPAWEAKVDHQGTLPFEQSLTESDGVFTFEVRTTAAGEWTRPPAAVLPRQGRTVELVEGEGVVTETFVLLPLTGAFAAGETHRVRLRLK